MYTILRELIHIFDQSHKLCNMALPTLNQIEVDLKANVCYICANSFKQIFACLSYI